MYRVFKFKSGEDCMRSWHELKVSEFYSLGQKRDPLKIQSLRGFDTHDVAFLTPLLYLNHISNISKLIKNSSHANKPLRCLLNLTHSYPSPP